MITKTKIELARLEVQKWEHIEAKYKASGEEPPPFVTEHLAEARQKYADMTPIQPVLM